MHSTIEFQPGRFSEWLARALSGRGVVCDRVAFETTGRLTFRFSGSLGELSLWLASRTEESLQPLAECRVGLLVSPPDDRPRGDPSLLARFIASRLDRVVQRFHVPLLDLFQPNRPEAPLTFGPGLFSERLGPFLVPGRTRWGGFVFSGERFREGGIVYRFDSAMAAVEIRVVLGPAPEEAVFATRHLSGVLSLDERTPDERACEEAQVERYLGFLLSLCDSPGSRYERPSRHRSVVADGTLDWGSRLGLQFFIDEPGHDFLGVFYTLYGLRAPVSAVVHCERECGHMAVWDAVPYTSCVPSPMTVRPPADLAQRVLLTDLREADVVMGGERRLEAAIEKASNLAGTEMVLVAETCLVRVIGDDVAGCIESVRARSRCPVVDMDVSRKDANRQFFAIQSVWRSILEHRADRSLPRDARSLNLVGYGLSGSDTVRELASLLERIGVKVNACLFPGLDWEEARRFEVARLNLVNPWRYVREAFRAVEEWTRVPIREAPAPWGFAGTRRWLEDIAEAMGLSGAVPLPARDDLERFERLRGEASHHRVGFVILSTQAHSLLDPATSYGVSLPFVLGELGFPVTVLYFDPPEVRQSRLRLDPERFTRLVEEAVKDRGCASVVVFDREDDLPHLFSNGLFDLVYSEMKYDPRARAAGLGTFSIADLAMGYRGALRSQDRLLRRARNPFRRRYREWLV